MVVRTSKISSYLKLVLLMGWSLPLTAEEPYSVSIDGSDTWNIPNVTNFLDATSSLTTENSAVQLQVDATVGTSNGTVQYVANNQNGDPELLIRIRADGRIVDINWTFDQSRLPLGVNNPSITLRDIDLNTDGNINTGGGNEFCDRLEISALHINSNPIATTSINVTAGNAPTTFSVIPASANTLPNSVVIEANANDGTNQGEAIITVNADSVSSMFMRFEQCETADTDRPGSIGLVNGIDGGFSIFTTDLLLRKEWSEASINDTANLSIIGGTFALNGLNSTANSSDEVDQNTTQEIISGFDYTISEVLGASNVGVYESSFSCFGTGDADISGGVLTPTAADSNIICTYLNDARLADIRVTKADSTVNYIPGQSYSYTLTIDNFGPDSVNGVLITDILPAALSGATWICSSSGGAACPNASGSGSINETISTIPNGGQLIYTVSGVYPTDPTLY